MNVFQRRLKIAFAAILLCIGIVNVSAQDQERRINVGKQPAVIHSVGNELHVFCSGVDANFNRAFDAGDVAASWWILDASTLAVRSSFVFENTFLSTPPLRPGFTSNSVYLYQNGAINKYSLFTQQLVQANVIPAIPASAGEVSAIGVIELSIGDVVFALTRPSFTAPGLVYSHLVGIEQLDNPDTTGINPRQIWFSSDLLTGLILNEGGFGQNNSTLEIANTVDTTTTKTVVNLGDTGNFFLVNGDSAFVVMNGSHTVQVVDLLKKSIVKTISTGTSGGSGPRECAINGDTLFVTTYNSDIREFSISTGQMIKTMQTSGKVDPIAWSNGKVVAGISLAKDSFAADSALAVFGLPVSDVSEKYSPLIPSEIYPNPVRENAVITANFSQDVKEVTIEIFNVAGLSVRQFKNTVSNGELYFSFAPSELSLSQGQYMCKISSGKSFTVIPFAVVK